MNIIYAQVVLFLAGVAAGNVVEVANPAEVAAVIKQHAEALGAMHRLPQRKVLEAAELLV